MNPGSKPKMQRLLKVGLLLAMLCGLVYGYQSGASPENLYSWDYSSGLRGPDHWIEVAGPEATQRCGNHNQSPIDLLKALATEAPDWPEVILQYAPTKVRLESKFYTVQLNYEPGSVLHYKGDKYDLNTVRFHVPSEHTYMGERAAMEIQFMHRKQGDSASNAIVAVLVDEGESNTEIRKFLKCMPQTISSGAYNSDAQIFPQKLFPPDTDETKFFFHYSGSISTPMCNDQVPWWVMETHITASKAEIEFFKSVISWPNTRNLQPLWTRKVYHSNKVTYKWLKGTPSSCETCPCSERLPMKNCPPPPTKWTYGNMDVWGQLDKEYVLCNEGQHQSPITFSNNTLDPVFPNPGLPALVTLYNNVNATLMNTGNGLIVLFDEEKPGYLRFLSKRYDLVQFHFHTPAEHSVSGAPGPMEVQMVHMNKEGRFTVVSVLFRFGEKNMFLDTFLQLFTEDRGCKQGVLNPGDLLPDQPHYITYEGSLTTPPCSEGTRWFVMKEMVTVSADQVQQVKNLLGNSARPMQATNNRMIFSSVLAGSESAGKEAQIPPDPFSPRILQPTD